MAVSKFISPLKPYLRPVKRKLQKLVRSQANRFRSNADIFDGIYGNNQWGGAPGQIYSGSGTYGETADRYVEAVNVFILDHGIKRVIDIGCGDFSIGKRIASECDYYIGADVSRRVTESNQRGYASPKVTFVQLDAVHDTLPAADACLIRQVLQHLSNADIKMMMTNILSQYRYVIVTEHYPSERGFRGFNDDKPTGPDIRVYDGSAVYLDRPPFNLKISKTLLDIALTPGQTIASKFSEDPATQEHLKTFVVEKSQQ